MGIGGSKREPVNDQEQFVFDQRKIYFDDLGNIRYAGHEAKIPDKELEKEKIMRAELNIDDKTQGQTWNIVDSVWIESWLYFAQMGEFYPRPGPCRNDRLVEMTEDPNDPTKEIWVGRHGMQMAVKTRKGDYRRVHPNTWAAIKEYYPSSGPEIQMVFIYEEKLAESGAYDVSSWKITPDDHMMDAHHRKKKKNKHHELFTGKSFRSLATSFSSKKIGDDGNGVTQNSNNDRLLSNDSEAPNFEDIRDESGSNDPILSKQPDSDDDDEAEANPYAKKEGVNAVSPMKKVLLARSFLGASAANDTAKEAGRSAPSYSKVGGADAPARESEQGVLLQPMSDGGEDRRESFFADVFFGSSKT